MMNPVNKEKLFDIVDNLKNIKKYKKEKYSKGDIENAFLLTCEKGYFDLLKFLLNFIAKDRIDLCIYRGMYHVSLKRHTEIMIFLISKGKGSIGNFNNGMEGAARGGHKDLIEFFISLGANDWKHAFYGAARGGHIDLLKFFIDKGARCFNMWKYGILEAVKSGKRDVVEFFIENGYHSFITEALKLARSEGYEEIIDYLEYLINVKGYTDNEW